MTGATGGRLPLLAVVAALAVLCAVPVTMALTDTHLDRAPALLVASTTTAAAAVGLMAAQPWLARRFARLHLVVGLVVVALVGVHVGALVVAEPAEALFAMSPQGPTRARAALLGTLALLAVAALGLLQRRLRWRRATFRLLHAGLAALAITLGVGHAVLSDGALDGAGTVILLTLGAAGLLGGVLGAIPPPAPRVPAGTACARRTEEASGTPSSPAGQDSG